MANGSQAPNVEVMARAISGMPPAVGQAAMQNALEVFQKQQQFKSTEARDLRRIQLQEQNLAFKKKQAERARKQQEIETAIAAAMQRRQNELKAKQLEFYENKQKHQEMMDEPLLRQREAEAKKAGMEADLMEQMSKQKIDTKLGRMSASTAQGLKQMGYDIFEENTEVHFHEIETPDGRILYLALDPKTGKIVRQHEYGSEEAFGPEALEELSDAQKVGSQQIYKHYGFDKAFHWKPKDHPNLAADLELFYRMTRNRPQMTPQEASVEAIRIGNEQRERIKNIRNALNSRGGRKQAIELASEFVHTADRNQDLRGYRTRELVDPQTVTSLLKEGGIQIEPSVLRKSEQAEIPEPEIPEPEPESELSRAGRRTLNMFFRQDDPGTRSIEPLVNRLNQTDDLSYEDVVRLLREEAARRGMQ